MPVKWCHNARTGQIFSYTEAEGITNFPRGELLAYGDYLTTGLDSKEEAIEWSKKWGCCDKCEGAASSSTKNPGHCFRCGTELKFVKEGEKC